MSARDWKSVVDKRIQEAMERGDFDNLPGTGKPLNLRRNPYAGDWELAFKAMKEAGFAPEWISLGKEIRTELEALRQLLVRYQRWYRQVVASLEDQPARVVIEERKRLKDGVRWAVDTFRERGTEVNKKIERHNLLAPVSQLHIAKIAIEDEIRAFEKALW